ncbi:MAG: outer membrane protein assembly factor BamE (lipoprotein component of BamABCDE complex) [Planctomycetota bacterium]|jgi:outer membrane protein assembly factor BamE (lipoprotein component of BamABCDE complex)
MKFMTRTKQIQTLVLALLCTLAASSCVNIDPKTGETIPRGGQRYEFSDVTSQVDKLKIGMSKFDCLMLLGSPAEKSERDDVWVYLPERPGVLIPARALRLKFEGGRLESHGYHAIVLGVKL